MSEKNIKSILLEERTFAPSPAFTARARIKPDDLAQLHAQARADYVGFWAGLARTGAQVAGALHATLWMTAHAPNYRWFTDGRLNASVQLPGRAPARARRTRPRSSSRASRATRGA